MTGNAKPIPTKERLAQELEKLPPFNGRDRLVKRARAGMYDDFESPLDLPTMQLVEDLRKHGQEKMIQRVINGEFDGTKEESDAWFHSAEGQAAFLELMFPHKLAPEEERKCPYCDKVNVESRGLQSGGPREGDASLCFYCLKWAMFDAELLLRKPTEKELATILGDPMAQKAMEAVKKAKAERQ